MEQFLDTIMSTDLSLFQMLIIVICLVIFMISFKTISLLNSFAERLKVSSKEKLSASQFRIFNIAVDNALKIISDVIRGLNQELVYDLKEKASDGKLTDDEKREILNNAILKIKSQLSTEVLNNLSICIGDIDSWLVSVIHKTLADIKANDAESQKLIALLKEQQNDIVSESTSSETALEIKQG